MERLYCKASVHCNPGLHFCKLDRNLLVTVQVKIWAKWKSAKKEKPELLVGINSIVKVRLSHRLREEWRLAVWVCKKSCCRVGINSCPVYSTESRRRKSSCEDSVCCESFRWFNYGPRFLEKHLFSILVFFSRNHLFKLMRHLSWTLGSIFWWWRWLHPVTHGYEG